MSEDLQTTSGEDIDGILSDLDSILLDLTGSSLAPADNAALESLTLSLSHPVPAAPPQPSVGPPPPAVSGAAEPAPGRRHRGASRLRRESSGASALSPHRRPRRRLQAPSSATSPAPKRPSRCRR